MDIRDARRINGTALAVALLLVLWLVFLALDDRGSFEWGWPTAALGKLSLRAWMWVVASCLTAIILVVALITFGVPPQPPGFARGSMRQVQCDACKAVFFIHDAGHRPIEHQCPGCKAIGIYDGTAAPVGEAPKPRMAKEIVQVGLTCRTCQHRFMTTDTGVRPLRVQCPNCKAVGTIR